jgi:hypothetical protein
MSGEFGPLDITCDAPPYPVVRACAGLGFRAPQDVRWRRVDRRDLGRSGGFFPWLRPRTPACTCGQPVPGMESYTFTFVSGTQSRYFLGQCARCLTIFWDKD